MFYDLHIPFPSSSSHATSLASSSNSKQPSKKQQKKAAGGGAGAEDWKKKQAEEDERKKGRDCWFGVPTEEREKCEAGVRMARHRELRFLFLQHPGENGSKPNEF